MALADNKVIARDMHTECCSEKKEEEEEEEEEAAA
jgi:hypothetical protein